MSTNNQKILYMGWLGYKNLGDELLWDLFKEKFHTAMEGQPWELTSTPPRRFIYGLNVDPFDVVVLGGGSIISKDSIDFLYNAMKKGKKVIIWGTGIDWIEKEDLELIEKGRCINLYKYFSKGHCEKLVEVIEHAEFAGVRGPLTYEFIIQMGANQDKLILSGDPGVLLSREQEVAEPLKRFEGSKIIGVNWGTSYNKIYGGSEKQVEGQLVKAIQSLIKKGYKFYFYSVWDTDIDFLKELYNQLNDADNIILDTNLHHQQYLLDLISNFYFTINLKLHGNVISAAADVPPILLAYRYKVFDFAQSINLNQLAVSTDSLTIEEEILNLEQLIGSDRENIIKNMRSPIQRYKKIINKPFNNLLYVGKK
ncbi:polysaccharide pyruvyl transferase family protein [Rossellomorea vietnamensis]|uniref:polysaccharide pyruvyl transferase family protein n=1 Tax=Rossellomorea vietnamensis TaxID=218284 RepID=UPI003CF0BFFE